VRGDRLGVARANLAVATTEEKVPVEALIWSGARVGQYREAASEGLSGLRLDTLPSSRIAETA